MKSPNWTLLAQITEQEKNFYPSFYLNEFMNVQNFTVNVQFWLTKRNLFMNGLCLNYKNFNGNDLYFPLQLSKVKYIKIRVACSPGSLKIINLCPLLASFDFGGLSSSTIDVIFSEIDPTMAFYCPLT